MAFYIKQNDTSPIIQATLKDASDELIDLTGASVRFHMRKIGNTTAKVDSAATVEDALNGVVSYAWQAADTDTIGTFQCEFEVTYIDGGIETFPNSKFITVEITDDIA